MVSNNSKMMNEIIFIYYQFCLFLYLFFFKYLSIVSLNNLIKLIQIWPRYP
jgi:hypothetical protein